MFPAGLMTVNNQSELNAACFYHPFCNTTFDSPLTVVQLAPASVTNYASCKQPPPNSLLTLE